MAARDTATATVMVTVRTRGGPGREVASAARTREGNATEGHTREANTRAEQAATAPGAPIVRATTIPEATTEA